MYLTYDEYVNMGGTLEESVFNDFAYEAEALVNWYTFNRLKKYDVIPEEAKRCVKELIRLLNKKSELSGNADNGGTSAITAGIASQSNDGVSISYNVLSASEAIDLMQDEIVRTIQIFLQGVTNELGQHLLFRGRYPGE